MSRIIINQREMPVSIAFVGFEDVVVEVRNE